MKHGTKLAESSLRKGRTNASKDKVDRTEVRSQGMGAMMNGLRR